MAGIALIDADLICYKAAAVSVPTIKWDDGDADDFPNEDQAAGVAYDMVKDWTKAAGCKSTLLVLSDRTRPKSSFRYAVHPRYKAQRPHEKPPLHDFVRDQLEVMFRHVIWPDLEGDDALGLMATGDEASKYVIVSIDKDMLTVPARVFNPDRDERPQKISVHQADYNWFHQTITGDATDNYSGAPGAGAVAARSALSMHRGQQSMWAATCEIYLRQFGIARWREKFIHADPLDEALMSARCARILRHGDWNKEKGVRLWHPDPDVVEWFKATEEE